MVEEMVVRNILTEKMIEAGATLLRRLDQVGFPVHDAFWMYVPQLNVWRLMISSLRVKLDGPTKVYRKIQSVTARMPEPKVSIEDITVIDVESPPVSYIRGMFAVEGEGPFRIQSIVINNFYVEDAYFYRLAPDVMPLPSTRRSSRDATSAPGRRRAKIAR